MRAFIVIAVAILALSIGWRYRDHITGLFHYDSTPPKPIVFDNGTVRDYGPPPDASAPPAQAAAPAGALRKCVKGTETTYTNMTCPPGFKEKTVSSDKVTVLAGQGPPKPAAGATPAERKAGLRDVLDVNDNRLREKIVERAVEQSTK